MTSKRYTGGSRQIRLPLFTNLGQKRASVRLKEFRKPDWPSSSDLLNQIVCSSKHSILVIFRNLLDVLPLCRVNKIRALSSFERGADGFEIQQIAPHNVGTLDGQSRRTLILAVNECSHAGSCIEQEFDGFASRRSGRSRH